MRALLTSGIKAILAIAALSTAAHWALRVQRDPGGLTTPALASVAEPASTGSIEPRRITQPQAAPSAVVPQQASAKAAAKPPEATRAGFDQTHLAALMSTATAPAAPRPAARAAAKAPAKASPNTSANTPAKTAKR